MSSPPEDSDSVLREIERFRSVDEEEGDSPSTSGTEDQVGSNEVPVPPQDIRELRKAVRKMVSTICAPARVLCRYEGRQCILVPSKIGPQGMQEFDVPSCVRAEHLEDIRSTYRIPNDVLIRAPEDEERIDWVIQDWTPMYTLWLSLGLTFPLSGLVREFCKRLRIAPSQINPNTLRILLVGDIMNKKIEGLNLTIPDLFAEYFVHEISGDVGRVMLRCHRADTKPFIESSSSDKGWKNRYFFVSGRWRLAEDRDIPFWWIVTTKKQCIAGHQSEEKIEKILRLDPAERNIRRLIVPVADPTKKGQSKGKEKMEGKKRGSKDAFKRLLSKKPSRPAEAGGSSAPQKGAEGRRLITMTGPSQKEKRATDPQVHQAGPAPEGQPAKRSRREENEKSADAAELTISVPPGTSFFTDPKKSAKALEGLVLEKDQEYLSGLKLDALDEFMATSHKVVQFGHFFAGEWRRQSDRVLRLREERQAATDKRVAAENEVVEMKTILKGKDVEISSQRQELKSLKAEIRSLEEKERAWAAAKEELEQRLKAAQDEAADIADRADVMAKGRVYQKFLAKTLKESTAKRRLGYWKLLLDRDGQSLPDPADDSSSGGEEEEGAKDDAADGVDQDVSERADAAERTMDKIVASPISLDVEIEADAGRNADEAAS